MKTNPQDAVKKLRQLRLIAGAAQRKYEAQFDVCFELGCRTLDMAAAIETHPSAVSNRRRRWRERRRVAEAVE